MRRQYTITMAEGLLGDINPRKCNIKHYVSYSNFGIMNQKQKSKTFEYS